jgi:hypothetical protein
MITNAPDDDLLSLFKSARRGVVKWAHYVPVYERLLSPLRGRPITLIEVGVGDGGSLEVWRRYLGPAARIIGVDCDSAASRLADESVEIVIGDQSNPAFWAELLQRTGPVDVLIDDGGHAPDQQIVTVACAVAHLRDGGVIVVEDTHSAFMPKNYPAARRFDLMAFAQHVVAAMHRRNPMVTHGVDDAMGFAKAIHRVEFVESMIVFHVDRRLCAASQALEAGAIMPPAFGSEHATLHQSAVAAFESQPAWLQLLLAPVRRLIGVAVRASRRIAAANRVRRYFR